MAIRHKRKDSAAYTWTGSDLVEGQIGINLNDGTLHIKKSAGGGGGYVTIGEDTGATQLNELSDVNTSTPTNRFALIADGVDFESRALVEADISDLQAYLTAEVNDLTAAVTWANVPDANITESSTTQHTAAIVTTAAVTTAGALMDSEVDADIKTLSLPASTTISAFGASLIDDAAASNARTTLDVDQAGTDNSTDVTFAGTGTYISLAGQVITVDPITESDISDLGAYLLNVVDDTTPQLGGDLDVNGQDIVSVSNGNITITPNGTGKTVIARSETPVPLNTQSGTTYTAVLSDVDKLISTTNNSPVTVTIPANASVAYPIGTKLHIAQIGEGQVTVDITSDTLTVNDNFTLLLNGQGAAATAIKVATTEWILVGNLEPAAGVVGISDVVDDTTPQLGGDLDVNGNDIVSVSNGDITITPNGTGDVILDGLKWPQADGTADYVLKTDGAGQLSWVAQGGGETYFADNYDGTAPSATGTDCLAIGEAATADSGAIAIAIGHTANASGAETIAIGFGALADTGGATAIGPSADAGGSDALALGKNTNASAGSAIAIGEAAAATATRSTAIGFNTSNSLANSVKIGDSGDFHMLLSANGRLSLSGSQAAYILPAYATSSEPTAIEGALIWDTTLNQLSVYNGSSWDQLNPSGGISDVVDDTTPQLGGDLDVNGNDIVSVSNGDILITPNGTGKTIVTSLEAPHDYQTQTGTSYTAVLDDADKIISLDNASAIAMTIPANSSVAYPVGTKLNFMQLGAGQVTVGITTDTLNVSSALTKKLTGQYSVATAVKVTSTTWVLFGDLEAA